ncbi:MAG: ankyrin repeat domain-containing protein [Planctomycetota bacterium]
MHTTASDRPRTPFWKAALHIAIATAVGNVLLAVAVWLGQEPQGYELTGLVGICGAFTATILIVAILGRARKYTTLVILVGYLGGLVVASIVVHLCGERSQWVLVPLWILVCQVAVGVVFSLYHPQASRRQVGRSIVVGIIALHAAVGWAAVFFFLFWDVFDTPLLSRYSSALPLIIMSISGGVGFPLAIAVTVRLLIGAADDASYEPSKLLKMCLAPSALLLMAIAIPYSLYASLQAKRLENLADAIYRGDMKFVSEVLEAEGLRNVNARTRNGSTLLHCAASGGNVETAALLVRKGADVNARIKGINVTPLHYAASAGHRDMVLFLLENGADPNLVETYGGYTPLDWAQHEKRDDIVEILRKHGAKSGKELRASRKD